MNPPRTKRDRASGAEVALRTAFLIAVAEYAPATLRDLADEPLRLYEAARPAALLENDGDAAFWSKVEQEQRPLARALRAWLKRSNLPRWTVFHAERTLWRWRASLDAKKRGDWELALDAADHKRRDTRPPGSGPHVRRLTRRERLRRVAASVDSSEFVTAARSLRRPPRDLARALQWTVEHRVLGLGLQQVADKAKLSVVEVGLAVLFVTRLLGYGARGQR